MKILVLIPVYKRPEVLKICLDNMTKFINQVSWEIEVVCILSPGDPMIHKNTKIVNEHGFRVVYFKNEPVSDKLNAGLQWVMEKCTFDYLMNFGSDDLIHPEIVKLYEPVFEKRISFFGITQLFFYELATSKTFHFSAYNFNGAIGAGRMISYDILKQFYDQQLPLYEPGLNCGLDTSSAMTIRRILGISDLIVVTDKFPYIVDIKTDTNINTMFEIESRMDCITYFDSDHLKKYYENIL